MASRILTGFDCANPAIWDIEVRLAFAHGVRGARVTT